MICKFCGVENEETANHCALCGTPLTADEPVEGVQEAPAPSPAPVQVKREKEEKVWQKPLTGKARVFNSVVAVLSLLVILASSVCAVFGGTAKNGTLDFLNGDFWVSLIGKFAGENGMMTENGIDSGMLFGEIVPTVLTALITSIMLLTLFITLIRGIVRFAINLKNGTDARVGGSAMTAYLAFAGAHLALLAVYAGEDVQPTMAAQMGIVFGGVLLVVILALRIAITGKADIKANKSGAHIAMAILTFLCVGGLLYALSCPILTKNGEGAGVLQNLRLAFESMMQTGEGENVNTWPLIYNGIVLLLLIVLIPFGIALLARLFRNISYPTERVPAYRSPMLSLIFMLLFVAGLYVVAVLFLEVEYTHLWLLLAGCFTFAAFVFSIADYCVAKPKKGKGTPQPAPQPEEQPEELPEELPQIQS